jgi:hypothetical protein
MPTQDIALNHQWCKRGIHKAVNKAQQRNNPPKPQVQSDYEAEEPDNDTAFFGLCHDSNQL